MDPREILVVDLPELGLPIRVARRLQSHGFETVGDLERLTAAVKIKGMAETGLAQLRRVLRKLERGMQATDGHAKGDPTPEEIKRRAAAIRARWPESRWEKPEPVVIPRDVPVLTGPDCEE